MVARNPGKCSGNALAQVASTQSPGPPSQRHLELVPPTSVTLSVLVLQGKWCQVVGRASGESSDDCGYLVTGQFPCPRPKARPLPCHLCSLPAAPVLLREPRSSSLALGSLSDLNEGGWCLTPCSNNSFLLPVSAADRASAQGGRERLSLATKRQPAGRKLSFRYLLPVRERKKN